MSPKEIEDRAELYRSFADAVGYLHGMALEDITRVGDFVETTVTMALTLDAKDGDYTGWTTTRGQ